MKGHKQGCLSGDGYVVSMYDSAMKSKSASSFPGLNASRRPGKLGDMLAQKKIDEARRLTPEQRPLIALQLSYAAAALHRAASTRR
jgi:hypothetical protein